MPSEDTLLKVIMVLSIAGIAISGYLTYATFVLEGRTACPAGEVVSCDVVITSEYSKIPVLGLSVAMLGLVGFIAIFVVTLWRFLYMDMPYTEMLRPVPMVLALLALPLVLWLITAELFWIDKDGPKICLWCTVAHVVLFTTLPFTFLLAKGTLGRDISTGLATVLRRNR